MPHCDESDGMPDPVKKTTTGRDSRESASDAEAHPHSLHGLGPVVGIGASAGGLEAFSRLLKHLPASTGMGFVLVQHLDPRHPSVVPELLANQTAMRVRQATNGTRIEPDHVYVIPPNTEMAVKNGVLALTPRPVDRARHLPIDFFLKSLAEDQKSRAIGVILSGSSSDGTIGLQAIKATGGITFAQDQNAQFDGMPRSAIAAGIVDFVLSPEAIAKEIADLANHFYMESPKSDAGAAAGPTLQNILSFLQTRTGVAFHQYKQPTVVRRLSRRMALNHSDSMEAYLTVLEQSPSEVSALVDDLLLVDELRGANEAAQSSNEELQSTNAELQTAKEELQSSNEELTTANEEMRGRNKELSQLNDDLVNLLSALQIPIVMLDRKLRIRRYTPVAEQVLSLIASDIGRPISDLRPRISAADLEELLAKVVESMQPTEREVQDQEGRWYSLRVHPYRTAEKDCDGAVLQLVSIDPLKRSSEEVRKARDYAETIISTVREPLLILDQELRVQTANRAFFETYRTSAAAALGRPFYELDNGLWDVPMVRRLIADLQGSRTEQLKTEEPREIEVEQEFPRLGWKAFQIYALRVDRGVQNGLILLGLQDITERKKAAEAKYRRLFEAAKDGIVIVDVETGKITDVNPYSCELLGVTRTDFIGRNICDVPPLNNLSDRGSILDRLRKEEIVRFPEIPVEPQPGRRVETEIVASMYEEGERRVAQFNIRDISERQQFNQKIQQTARLEGLGILAGGIAHDFNNLLSGILGNAGLALSDAPAGSPYQSALKDVVRASQRAADLTRQMLAYSGRGRFVVRPLNLSDLVVEVSQLVRSSVPSSVELKLDLAKQIPFIQADSGQVQQVIMNLILNGAEAIGEGRQGQVRAVTRLEQLDTDCLRWNYPTDALNPGPYVVLEVSDTGSGMDENTQARIFDPFFTTKFTGRGLGLASVHGIVHGHRGAIRVQSTLGRGSTFTVVFPAIEVSVAEPQPRPKPEELRGTGTILVVDDDEIALSTMQAILERNGYRVITAVNGEVGLRAVREHKDELSLVIMDLAMPVMGGAEAFRHISALAPDLPVLLTSGYDETEGAEKLGSNKPAGFIQKPAAVTGLLEKVKSVLNR